jgi:hypothetical protein
MGFIYIALLVGALTLIYKWLTKGYDQFEKQGIAHDKPLPLIGNMWPLVTKREGIVQFLGRNYYSFGNAK